MCRFRSLVILPVLGALALASILALPSGAGVRTDARTERSAAQHSDFVPVWSPDGRYIAFTRQTRQVDDAVFIVGANSGSAKQLVAPGRFPSWSPNGTRIAYYDVHVLTVKLDGTGRKQVARYGSFPLWSPDGRSILFERSWPPLGLYVVSAAGVEARRLARDASDAQWSPDGRRILFVTGGIELLQPGISVVGRDGKSLRALGPGSEPSWSPDGREIAHQVGGRAEPASVRVMWSDGSHARALAAGGSPVFSPDGKQIAYRGEDEAIWIVNQNGSNSRRVTRPRAGYRDHSQVWSPDGQALAFVRQKGVGIARIWLVNGDGTRERQLTR